MIAMTRKLAALSFAALGLVLSLAPARAGDDSIKPAIHKIETEWARIKFTVPPSDKQLAMMNDLGKQVDALAAAHGDRPDVLIWDGIILSERASMTDERSFLTGRIEALGLAKQARAVLERAYAMDRTALDAGAATSLGVLYARVPGYPIGFGDTGKARKLLEEAVHTAPGSLDAEYFYGDFLYNAKQYREAKTVLTRALALPASSERPIWDQNRRLVIKQLLARM